MTPFHFPPVKAPHENKNEIIDGKTMERAADSPGMRGNRTWFGSGSKEPFEVSVRAGHPLLTRVLNVFFKKILHLKTL